MTDPSRGTREQTPEGTQHLPPRPALAPGDTMPGLSSWVLERKLGGGGFGEVWLAKHAWNDKEKPRAVKFCTDPEARHRLVTHEKNVVLRVMKYAGDHPNIVPLLDCNLDGDVPWLMYEFVAGGTLAALIEQWRELPLPKRLGRAVRTLHAVAGALARCHRLGPPLVHRDLKPHNVLMADGKVPRITDFGIGGVAVQKDGPTTGGPTAFAARVPTALQTSGSRLYAPPEQLFGNPPNPRDDVYALGVIAYQAIFGDLTTGPGSDAVLEMRDLKVPAELAALIVRSVALNPDRRPADATEWEQKLAALLPKRPSRSDSLAALPPGVPPPGAESPTRSEEGRSTAPDPPPHHPPDPPTEPPSRTPPQKPNSRPPNRHSRAPLRAGALAVLLAGACGAALYLTRDRTADPPRPGARSEPHPGEAREIAIADGVRMTFCWVPPGRATLGSPEGRKGYIPDQKERPYTSRGFWLGKYEVTQSEWAAVMAGTDVAFPSRFRPGGPGAGELAGVADTGRFPVDSVSWDDCQEFLKRANAYGDVSKVLGRSAAFALPHEDEWEYACRGGRGNQTPFYFGDELNGTQANCDGRFPFGTTVKGDSLGRPTAVGSYAARYPHPWGLCDMHGNVCEWCDNTDGARDARVLRGGSWLSNPLSCHAAFRTSGPPSSGSSGTGFRVCVRAD